MNAETCPGCSSSKIVAGDCYGTGADQIACRFVPDDETGWWEAVKHVLGSAGIGLGRQKFRYCGACGHLWMDVKQECSGDEPR